MTLLHVAALNGRRRVVEELLVGFDSRSVASRDRHGRTPLLCCAERGETAVAETLVVRGDKTKVDVNERDATGATALSIAARLGHAKFVRWLLARHDIEPMRGDYYGAHALHKAVAYGQINTVVALLADRRVCARIDEPTGRIDPSIPRAFNAGASQGHGETALHLACGPSFHTCHARITRALLAAGADPNRSRGDGRTAVHNAVASGNASVVRELARSGRVWPRTWEAKDTDGNTPRDLAQGNGAVLAVLECAACGEAQSDVVACLRKSGVSAEATTDDLICVETI